MRAHRCTQAGGSAIFELAGVAAPTVTERLRRAVIQMPVDPRSISPDVPGSGVGVGVVVPATNVPFTKASVSLLCSRLEVSRRCSQGRFAHEEEMASAVSVVMN